jgi:MoxR-like ATPase
MIGKDFQEILKRFNEEKKGDLGGNLFASTMRNEFRDNLRNLVTEFVDLNQYKVTISPGLGNKWANIPWAGIRNTNVTDSFMKGFYIVYLFQADGKGVYLTLNQGITEIIGKRKYNNKKRELEDRALKLRESVNYSERFSGNDIDLKSDSAEYEAGNIISKYYSLDDLNDEKIIHEDLKELLKIYDELIPVYNHLFLSKGKRDVQVWQIYPGTQDVMGHLWQLFKNEGYIGVGWFKNKDYRIYKSKNDVKNDLIKNGKSDKTYTHQMIWDFTHSIKIGDIIIASVSRAKIAGIGVVKSDYINPNDPKNPKFDDQYKHLRKVEWVIPEEIEFKKYLFGRNTISPINDDRWDKIKETYIKNFPYTESIFNKIEKKQQEEPPIESFNIPHSKITTKLKINEKIKKQICAALNSGKHVILTGAPGTGKTELAIDICKSVHELKFSSGYLLTTATSDWTTFDTIGGYLPDKDIKLKFEDGIFLKAIKNDNWLIIDEINRADIDKAFGQLFTVLSGQPVELPFLNENKENIKIFPNSSYRSDTDSAYQVNDNWRIIATMNVYDKDYLFDMSYAFLRRFSLIELELPSTNVYEKLIKEKGKECELEEGDVDLIIQLIDIKHIRKIGPAIYLDMVKYMAQRKDNEDDLSEIVEEAFLSFMLPQFEGIDTHKIQEIWNTLPNDLRTANVRLKLQDFTLDELK